NRWQFVVALLGGLKAGLTLAPIDPLLKAEERAEIVADLKPALVLDELTTVEAAEWTTREATLAPALVLYTSGSTGRPKCALLSHTAVGRAVPGVQARVVDDEDRTLDPGEVGELLIRTPAAMDGYLGAPEETRAVIAGGWFRTGDLATIDPGGWVRITGRKRERILRG